MPNFDNQGQRPGWYRASARARVLLAAGAGIVAGASFAAPQAATAANETSQLGIAAHKRPTHHSAPRHHAAPVLSPELLTVGDRGAAVSQVQRALHRHAMGYFGSGTRKAVTRFQRRRHLIKDGVVGPQTRRAMHLRVRIITPRPRSPLRLLRRHRLLLPQPRAQARAPRSQPPRRAPVAVATRSRRKSSSARAAATRARSVRTPAAACTESWTAAGRHTGGRPTRLTRMTPVHLSRVRSPTRSSPRRVRERGSAGSSKPRLRVVAIGRGSPTAVARARSETASGRSRHLAVRRWCPGSSEPGAAAGVAV